MIYGVLNADISDNAAMYCAIPFGHYMGDHIVSLNEHTCSEYCTARQCWPVLTNFGWKSIINKPFIGFRVVNLVEFPVFHWSPLG